MPQPARDRLAHLLAGTEPARADSATLRLPPEALTLEIEGVGPVQTPVRAAQAKQLIAAARPAQFGHGEQTLSDPSVRDTWELTPEQVRLAGDDWQAQLEAALAQFRDELGLPAGAALSAELHSMLVYGKDQFFLPHQDSEKHDEMIASLVVMLPSVHTGGELVVDDAGHQRTYRGSREELVLVAFYADRRHEVRPVKSGHRVTLTFNLLLTRPGAASAPGPVEAAASLLTEHFTTSVSSRYGGRDLGKPTRLAFLLDHEYTQAGLAAGRFKGADADRAATLESAAAHAGCESVFALAEIQETWDVMEADGPWGHPWSYDGYDDEQVPDAEYELNDLIDDAISLGWWVEPDGSGAESIQLPLGDHEVSAATPTHSLEPYDSEYEGYMGNYGNTLDRWYRRAAVVVWPTEKSFAARAEAGSSWALRRLLERIEAGDLDTARQEAASLQGFWHQVEPELLDPALQVAAGLKESTAARVVLAPFRIEMLRAAHAPPLATLSRQYGEKWLLDLIRLWESSNRIAGADRHAWITGELLPLCQALRDQEAHPAADVCAELAWRWLASRIDTWASSEHPERRRKNLAELAVPLARTLESASEELGENIVAQLRTSRHTAPELLVPTLRAHRGPTPPALRALAHDCHSHLTSVLDSPVRAQGDWSISWTGCGCEVCERLAEFLDAHSERTEEWPLAKRGRQHVHQQIDAAGLPVQHTTRRQGRPYTLVLTKTEDLFRVEDEARRQAGIDLSWLKSAFT